MNKNLRENVKTDIWSQYIDGSFGSFKVKTFVPKGEFGWHVHDDCDELFVAIQGEFTLKLRDKDIHMKEGDSYLVTKGLEHTTIYIRDAKAVVIRCGGQAENNMHRIVEIVEYDSSWPEQFSVGSARIQKVLGDNCIDVHHIGSTSVPGLAAKPVIDIMPVVKDITKVNILGLESIGYKNKGELGMPFRVYMSKGSPQHTHHLHIWEIGNPEIEKHLLFRDYLINNATARDQYADLKHNLAQQYKDAHQTYTTLKDAFIKGLVAKTGFNGLTVVQPLHDNEWQEYHRIKKQQIFDPLPHIKYDPNHPTLTDPKHYHFVMMKGIDVIAVAQIEMFDEETAALRILATDSPYQGQGYGTYFLNLLERWVLQHGKIKILMHAATRAEQFYRRHGYTEMEFNDDGVSDDHIDLGRLLNN